MRPDRESKVIAIVDDDGSMRSALQGLLKAVGLSSQAFESAEDFLGSGNQRETACLIADIRMPGMSGLELQARLNTETLQNSYDLHYSAWRRRDAASGLEGRCRGILAEAFRR